MSLKKISFVLFLGVAATGALYVHAPGLLRKWLPKDWHTALRLREMPGSYIGNTVKANEWSDTEALETKLRDMIDERLTGDSPEQVKEFMKNPENRLILAQHAMAHAETNSAESRQKAQESYNKTVDDLRRQLEDSTKYVPAGTPLPPKIAARNQRIEKRLAAIEKEVTSKHSTHDAVTTPSGAALMDHLSNNLDWVEQFNATGERTDIGAAVAIMEKIAQKNPEMMYNQMERDIATATALEFAHSGWAQEDAVTRAMYFTNAWRAGKLNKVFDTLPLWQRRLVVGLKGKGAALGAGGNDKAGNVESMEYSLDNVHLPAYRYTNSCWQAPYRRFNIYGEIIHGDGYHQTFNDMYGNNFNNLTREVGGVCGGLSHYGATSAAANGVPALTSGEPSHCSYIVLVDDKWQPSYSLSWQRGLHWQVFGGNNKYSALHMATQLFSPEQKEKTDLSQAMRNLANAYASSAPEKATNFYMNSVKEQPLNYYAWREYAQFLSQNAKENPAAWSAFCKELNKSMAPGHPEMAAELLKAHVYPSLKEVMADKPEELRETVLSLWDSLVTMGPDENWDKGNHGRWDVEGLCNAQLNLLKIDPKKNPAIKDYFTALMSKVAKKPDYLPVMLAWGNSLLEKMDPKIQPEFVASMVSSLNQGSADASDDERAKMLAPVILAAERTGDITSFQAIGKTLPEKYRNPEGKIAAPTNMKDPIVSRGGIIQTSSSNNGDNPCNHWGLLEPGIGGHFHTGKDTDAWVKVTLPKQANITAIVIQATAMNMHRLHNMKVQVSETGADDDWTDVKELGQCTKQRIEIDLKSTAPLAKYVRIVRKGGPEFFHLRGIFVYGKPAA